ncbi:MAG: hypothetical protein Q7S73_02550 [bacterium]|nr:hypothetical protein [bacterium]
MPTDGDDAYDKELNKKYVNKWVLCRNLELFKVIGLVWTTMDLWGGPINYANVNEARIDCVFSKNGTLTSFTGEISFIVHIFGEDYPSEAEVESIKNEYKTKGQ